MNDHTMTRRAFAASILAGVAGSASAGLLTHRPRGPEHVVIVGGGAAGAEAATVLRASGQIAVTLIERDPTRLGPCATGAFAQTGKLTDFVALKTAGVDVVVDEVAAVDWDAARFELFSGRRLSYDRVILAPGTAAQVEPIPGLDARARHLWPAAWGSDREAARLTAQLAALPEGGHVVLRLPNEISHPQVALARIHDLLTARPDARLSVLDASPDDRLRRAAIAALPVRTNAIAWHKPGSGGVVLSIDVDRGRLETDAGAIVADVVNFVPPRNAGSLAIAAGLTNETGWCPTDRNGVSILREEAVILGDARADAIRTVKSACATANDVRT